MKYTVKLDLSIQHEEELNAAEAKVKEAARAYHDALRELDDVIALVKFEFVEKPSGGN